MREEQQFLQYGIHTLEYVISRRDRKTLEIAVDPDGSVQVTAPLDAPMKAIEDKIRKRAAWIRRQQAYFAHFLPRTPDRLFVPGETHLYLGRQYRLKVVETDEESVKLVRGFITVRTNCPTSSDLVRDMVNRWYHERAKAKFVERLELNVRRFPSPERFRPKGLIVRPLAQRWGSMSPSGRLLLNRRLVQAPVDAIDYVITHELCHIAEPHHGTPFVELLERTLPDWRTRKEKLERIMA